MLWQYVGPMYVVTSPLVVDDVVYVGSYNTVYAFDAQRNHKIWSYSVEAPSSDPRVSWVSSFVVDAGLLYFCAADGGVYALETDSGKKVWNFTYTAGVPFYAPQGPLLSDGLLYMGSETGSVCALNASDGTKIWSSVIGKSSLSVPAVYENVLYFGSDDGNLYALNATSGLELWRYTLSRPFSWNWGFGGVGSPVICDGVLYVRSGESVSALAVSSSFVLPSLPFYLPPFLVLLIVVVVVVVVACCVCFYLLRRRKMANKPNAEF
ncbi:PQQ-binding-like beta-propeller repeat protein [Candidatus Bathycorpusculum sp.]|uniref:outer membrane protein assembly factor BamB family protein n=1 Tax=Candidatus Bathycorpusculum sp. TaxID=2994959 RepID=UPI002837476F|nr:PQQ-binding-like beta-propeller repeat protein [Candidatus Termitimicrobium sp.]MCL2686533.1 PQQ-binding-like beta-propeller repeat protein [Candidatus Termitimicrobium sp.]